MSDKTNSCDVRERILAAGQQAFQEKSYNGCGLKEILAAADVAKGSFYHYFQSKEDFALCVIDRETEMHLAESKTVLLNRQQPPLARLTAYFEDARQFYIDEDLTPNCIVPKLAMELSQLSPPMRTAITNAYSSWQGILEQAISEGQQSGEFSAAVDARDAAGFIVDAWQGVNIRLQLERDINIFDRFVKVVFGLLVSASSV